MAAEDQFAQFFSANREMTELMAKHYAISFTWPWTCKLGNMGTSHLLSLDVVLLGDAKLAIVLRKGYRNKTRKRRSGVPSKYKTLGSSLSLMVAFSLSMSIGSRSLYVPRQVDEIIDDRRSGRKPEAEKKERQ